MDLIFFVEARYIRDSQGNIYNIGGVLKFPLWNRYLEVFDKIIVVARVRYEPNFKGKLTDKANSEKVEFFDLPHFLGPLDFLKKRNELYKRLRQATALNGAFLLRVPGQIGTLAADLLFKKKIGYGVEVVGDPYDVFSQGAVEHPFRVFFKYKYYLDLKKIVKNASSVLYVTEKTLQKRYLANTNAFVTSASNVVLEKCNIKNSVSVFKAKPLYNIVSIGSLEQMYKGPDVVIEAVSIINSKNLGYKVCLVWIGSGKYLDNMKMLAKTLLVEDAVDFVGYIGDKAKIITHLDQSDIFVLASRTEGLPRVIIEAMARGLPIIGTKVGGIPELLSREMLIRKNDPQQLADKIQYLIENRSVTAAEKEKNLKNSHLYSEEILIDRRKEFYNSLIKI